MRIAMVSANGGSGRTTLILNLAVGLCRRGLRTLMVDLDPQGSLGFLLARRDDEWRGIADYLMGRVTLERAVKKSNLPLLSLLPRGRLDPADAGDFERAVGRTQILRAGLRNLEKDFDVLLLDTPAGTGMVPTCALAVADEVLVTIRADALAVRAAIRSLRMVELVRERRNRKLTLAGVLPTFVTEDRQFEQALIREMRRHGVPVFEESVPESDAFRRACDLGQPLQRLSGDHSRELKPIQALADLFAFRASGGRSVSRRTPTVVPLPSNYEKFSARRFREKNSIAEHMDAPGGGRILDLEKMNYQGTFGAREWDSFLDACMRAAAGETAFAMDSQGLVLASRGKLDDAEVACVGTRLTSTLHQSRRMEISSGDIQTALVEFEHQWLTGIAVVDPDGDFFTIGVLASEPVPPRIRGDIRTSLRTLLFGTAIGVGYPLDDEDDAW